MSRSAASSRCSRLESQFHRDSGYRVTNKISITLSLNRATKSNITHNFGTSSDMVLTTRQALHDHSNTVVWASAYICAVSSEYVEYGGVCKVGVAIKNLLTDGISATSECMRRLVHETRRWYIDPRLALHKSRTLNRTVDPIILFLLSGQP